MIKTSVYIMTCGDFMKVGMAGQVQSRLASIQASNPVNVEVAWSNEFPDKRSAAVTERATHKKLKESGFHLKLEWFYYTHKSFSIAVDEIKAHNNRDYICLYKRISAIRDRVRATRWPGGNLIFEHLTQLGFIEEAKAIRKGHYGPYISFEVTECGVEEAERFIESEAVQ
jgi:hypothetical protein